MANLLKTIYHVTTQGYVELLAVDPDPGPFFGWIPLSPAVSFANRFSLWQDP
jgi:hypothetical protein